MRQARTHQISTDKAKEDSIEYLDAVMKTYRCDARRPPRCVGMLRTHAAPRLHSSGLKAVYDLVRLQKRVFCCLIAPSHSLPGQQALVIKLRQGDTGVN